jgi:sugar lactone lactonase YvrE
MRRFSFPANPVRTKSLVNRRAVASLCIALALPGCGGGGGGASPQPAVQAGAAIVADPASQTVTAGQTVTFTVSATGSGLSYQWQRDGKDLPGATASSYVLAGVQMTDDGASFTVIVKDPRGSVSSKPAILGVKPPLGLSLMAGPLGGKGNADGAVGRFQLPFVKAVSPAGVVYVTDHYLRTITPAAGGEPLVTTLQSPMSPPTGLVFDTAGNRYETYGQGIRKTTPGGVSTMLAGDQEAWGWTDGTGAAARFAQPRGLAIDAAGNLYVAEDYYNLVRKVTPAGVVTTLAGSPGDGSTVDGVGAAARFDMPHAIAVDGAGNVFVGTRGGYLRKITPGGVVTTLPAPPGGRAGDISGFATDKAGNLYIAQTASCALIKMSADGQMTVFAGKIGAAGSADGVGDQARFCAFPTDGLFGIAIDANGALYVGDPGNATVRAITPEGRVGTLAGRAATTGQADGTGAAARFDAARILSLDVDLQHNVYVSEGDHIRKIARSGVVSTLNLPPQDLSHSYFPSGMRFGGGLVAFADGVISRIDANGAATFVAGKAGERAVVDGSGDQARFYQPINLSTDAAGNLYFLDDDGTTFGGFRYTSWVRRKISPAGVVTTVGVPVTAPDTPWAMDKEGSQVEAILDVKVIDPYNSQNDYHLVRTAPDGTSTTLPWTTAGVDRGKPTALAIDRGGNVYVAEETYLGDDMRSTVIRKYTPSGVASVIAGRAGSAGVILGTLPASLGSIKRMTVDDEGEIYLVSENSVLRLVQ